MKKHITERLKEEYISPITKDNHLIPQFLLRNFCKQNTQDSMYINITNKVKSNPILKSKKIRFPNMFSNKLIFNNNLESNLGKIEDKVAPITQKLKNISFQNLKYNHYIPLLEYDNSETKFFNQFNFSNIELDNFSELWTSIIFRLHISKRHNPFIINKEYEQFIDNYSTLISQEQSLSLEEKTFIYEELTNFTNLLNTTEPTKLIMDLNEQYYDNSVARQQIKNFILNCLQKNMATLIVWNAPIIPISNHIPYSLMNNTMILPISANSLLYLDKKIIDSQNTLVHINNNSFTLLNEYINNIYKYGNEFLYYDRNIVQNRLDYNSFKFISAHKLSKKN